MHNTWLGNTYRGVTAVTVVTTKSYGSQHIVTLGRSSLPSANQALRQRGGGQVRLGGIRPVSRTDTHRSHANVDIAILDASPRQWRRVGFAKRSSGVRARIDPFKRASGNLTHAFVPRRILTPPHSYPAARAL
jgi:hypothetical protein